MLGERNGAGDEQVCVLKQHHQLPPARRVGLALCVDAGNSLPRVLHGATNAVLVVFGEPVPKSRIGPALFELLTSGEIGDRAEKGSEFVVALSDGGARGA